MSIDKIRKEYETIRTQMEQLLEEYQAELRRYERREKETISDLRKTLSNISNCPPIQTPSAKRLPECRKRRVSGA